MNNEYILICNYDQITKDKLLDGYVKDNFNVIYNEQKILLLKKENSSVNKENEELMTNLFINMLKKFNVQKSIVVDLSSDFKKLLEYISKCSDISPEKNKTTWYLRQIITKILAK